MHKIDTPSFQIVAETKQEAFNILLKVTGYDVGSFSKYMGIDLQILEDAPQWAINYLKDIVNAELKHLGYFIKDTKTTGLKSAYDVADSIVNDLINNGTITMQPFKIKSSIVSEDAGNVEIRYLINAQDILSKIVADNAPAE
jgi:hypothetical protein